MGLSYLLVLVATVVAVGRFADMWGAKLPVRLWVRHLHHRLRAVRARPRPRVAHRVPGAPGHRRALLQANSVAIILLAVPKPSLGRAIGIQGAARPWAWPSVPLRGGLLLAAGGWRLIFFVNVPFGLVGVIAGVLLIPRSRHLQDRSPFDWQGFSLFLPPSWHCSQRSPSATPAAGARHRSSGFLSVG